MLTCREGSLVGHSGPWLHENWEGCPGIYIRKWTWDWSRLTAGNIQVWVPLPHACSPFKKTLPLILYSKKKGREKLSGPGSQLLALAFVASEQKEKKGNVLSYPLMLQKWLQLICECWSYERYSECCFVFFETNQQKYNILCTAVPSTQRDQEWGSSKCHRLCFPGPQSERFLQSIPLCHVSKGAPKNSFPQVCDTMVTFHLWVPCRGKSIRGRFWV